MENLQFIGRGDAVYKCVWVLLATVVNGAVGIAMSAVVNKIVYVCLTAPF